MARPVDPDPSALEALDEATRAIAALRDPEDVLQLIVDRVRSLVGARYAALGIVDGEGRIERFITAGITPAERAAIGPPPRGHGLLGLIIREGRTFRVRDIGRHPESYGFPPNHPPMTSFLGVPVTIRDTPVGNLYLTDKVGAPEFTEVDQRLVEMFALHAGIAMDNARLHDQVGQFAVVEERDRIGREIHDGIIQSLYAVSLSLEEVPDLLDESRDLAEARVESAIDTLHLAIRDLRNFIYGLRPEMVDGAAVPAGVVALAEQLRRDALVEVDVDVDPSATDGLSTDDGQQVLQLAREALSNVARHARAGRVAVTLTRDVEGARLVIADDGVGFDHDAPVDSTHRGLRNMRARADAIGASLAVEGSPGGGTRIILTMPTHDAAARP